MKPQILVAMLAAALSSGGRLGASQPSDSAVFAVVDTLGAATPATQFSVLGSSGEAILSSQFVGPQFTLAQETVITEVGGFVNNCKVIVSGVPECPGTVPFTVQIRPSVNGAPDASTVLATFVLSHDNEPLIISYESISTNLTLEAGIYFALFAPQDGDGGSLLDSASDPFNYQSGLTTLGFLDPTTGTSFATQLHGAVRILGRLKGAAELLDDLLDQVVSEALGPGSSLASKLETARAALGAGSLTPTCGILSAFSSEARAQSGKALTVEQATQLITAADRIRAALAC